MDTLCIFTVLGYARSISMGWRYGIKGTQKIGKLGEDIAVRFLEGAGYRIIERNVRRVYGEIDIVAERGGEVSFVEVKTARMTSAENPTGAKAGEAVSQSAQESRFVRPEENLTREKLAKCARAGALYARKRRISKWRVCAVAVYLDAERKEARCVMFDALEM